MQQSDILIIGAGPVGLVAALKLAQAGVRVEVFEKAAGLERDLRASTFHPATLDMLAADGLTTKLLARGLKCPDWQIRMHETGERAVFDLSVLNEVTAHPFRLQCEQWKLVEELIALTAAMQNISVHWSHDVTALEQDSEGVTIYGTNAQGEKFSARGRYAIGADGARSAVRGLVNLPFEGDTYPEATILAVTEFPFHEHLEGLSHVNYCWKANGTFSLLRLPGIWRTSLYPDPGEAHEDALKPESIERKLQKIVPRDKPYDVLEIRDYRIHRRLVPHFRVGRVVLAGDSAHVHSPSGGMGLNGGIHDAFALSDALLKILNGADESLLDLYSRQRCWVAEQGNLKISHENRSRMQEKDPQKRREELAALQAIASDRDKCFEYVYKSSMFWGLDRAREIT